PNHEAMQDINWKAVPPLGGYVATTVKQNAELVLMSHQEDPVLATWRYGLGRAAAFTSDAKSKWGVLWLRWGDFNKFWAQLTRWTLRSGSRSDTTAIVQRIDQTGEVVVDAVDGKGEFINFLDSQIGVVAPNRERSVVDLEQIGPGRYRGRFPAPQEGVYLVGMAQRKAERVVGSQLAGLVVPYAQELRDLGVDETLLGELAELTGGSALQEPQDAFLKLRRRSRIAVEIWPWLVGIVALMMVPDIDFRGVGRGHRAPGRAEPARRRRSLRPRRPHQQRAGAPAQDPRAPERERRPRLHGAGDRRRRRPDRPPRRAADRLRAHAQGAAHRRRRASNGEVSGADEVRSRVRAVRARADGGRARRPGGQRERGGPALARDRGRHQRLPEGADLQRDQSQGLHEPRQDLLRREGPLLRVRAGVPARDRSRSPLRRRAHGPRRGLRGQGPLQGGGRGVSQGDRA